MKSKIGKENAGYKIIAEFIDEANDVVIGEAIMPERMPNKYVVWTSDPDQESSYYWGHYVNTYQEAIKSLKVKLTMLDINPWRE